LFERTTRRVHLTDAGKRLLPHARTLLEDAARCRAVAAGDARPLPFSFTIGTRYELGISWLCPALAGLEAHGIAVLPRYFIAEDLAAGRLTVLLPDVEPKRDWFRLLWRSGHPREAELVALAEALRELPLR